MLSVRADAADIFVPANYPTLQAAINAAAPGAVIHLAAGKYPEMLTITKSVTIIGSRVRLKAGEGRRDFR